MARTKISLPIIFALMLLLASCSSAADQAATETAESEVATAVALGMQQTAEARSSDETQSAEDAVAEAATKAILQTQTAKKAGTSTAAVANTATRQVKNATNTQKAEDELAAIDKILQSVGHSISSGNLRWRQSDFERIIISSGNYRKWSGLIGNRSYSNFVIHFNTTWDTSGLAGCGLIFRSERNLLNGQQYIFDAIRFSGFPGWRVRLFQYSDYQANITGGTRFTDKLDLDNLATNNFVLVADGTTLIVYVNGSRAGVATIATRSSGYFSFYAWQTDGSTTCTFKDGWIWELP